MTTNPPEVYDGSVFGDGNSDATCTGCHGGSSSDFVLTPFPLQ